MRTALFSILVLLTFIAAPASGQERLKFAAGGGLTLSGYSGYGSGGHLLGAATAHLSPVIALRLDAVASLGNYEYFGFLPGEDPDQVASRTIDRGLEPIVGGSIEVLLRWPREGIRPYVFAGPGYFHSYWSEYTPSEHDFGWAFGLGVQKDFAGREWFAELGGRAFGNFFYTHADTKAVWPITVGLHF